MSIKEVKLNKKQYNKLNDYMKERFIWLEGLRTDLDDKIQEDTDVYNDFDKHMQAWDDHKKQGKMWWEEKQTVPYVYTIVQTMVARLIQSFFGKQNYLKIYVEDKAYKDIESNIQQWLQTELDRIKLKGRARDFLEDSLVQRTTWLYLRPVMTGKKMSRVDFNTYQWFDVWFDTKVTQTEDTDFFLRNIFPLWRVQQNKNYKNTDQIPNTVPPDETIKERQVYEAKHDKDKEVTYYDPEKENPSDEVEVMYYLTWYDISKKEGEPDYQPIIVHWANREVIMRVERVDIDTMKKFWIFPIRPVRQANSLIGKSPAQITKSLQYLLNEVLSYTIHNYKLLVKLLFKYKKDADVDMDELWAGAGNAIGYGESPGDVDIFNIPNMVNVGMVVISWIIQFMQQATGAVDYLMGTSAARGPTETASGIKTITEQAMFKFQMMAENVYTDILEFVNWVMILWIEYNPDEVRKVDPKLKKLTNLTAKDLEDSRILDIGINDLTLRRDAERTQFLNGINIIAGLVEKVQGNVPALLQEVMKKLEVENAEEIMKDAKSPAQLAAQQQILMQAMQNVEAQANQKKGGSNKANPQAENAASVEEEESNTTPAAAEEI